MLKRLKNIWLNYTNPERRLIAKAMSLSSSDRVCIMLDQKTQMVVYAYNGKCVPVRTFDKADNLIPLVSNLLNNNKRPTAMSTFIRQFDGAIFNLVMNDKKFQKKLEKLNKEAQGVQFGVKPKNLDAKDALAKNLETK